MRKHQLIAVAIGIAFACLYWAVLPAKSAEYPTVRQACETMMALEPEMWQSSDPRDRGPDGKPLVPMKLCEMFAHKYRTYDPTDPRTLEPRAPRSATGMEECRKWLPKPTEEERQKIVFMCDGF